MPPDRLSELRRQRDLIRAHLHWLDTEIARASDDVVAPTPDPDPGKQAPAQAEVSAAPKNAPLPAVETASVQSEVRRGCLIYVAIAILLGIGLIAFIYWRY